MPSKPPIARVGPQRTEAERKAVIDRMRGSAASRGYDANWQKLRYLKLATDPLCECDDCLKLPPLQRPLANVVDHRIPIEQRPDLRLAWDNLRSMYKPHHDRRTARDQGFARRDP